MSPGAPTRDTACTSVCTIVRTKYRSLAKINSRASWTQLGSSAMSFRRALGRADLDGGLVVIIGERFWLRAGSLAGRALSDGPGRRWPRARRKAMVSNNNNESDSIPSHLVAPSAPSGILPARIACKSIKVESRWRILSRLDATMGAHINLIRSASCPRSWLVPARMRAGGLFGRIEKGCEGVGRVRATGASE